MASAALLPPYSSTLTLPKTLASLSTSQIACPKYPICRSLTLVPQHGLAWNGLRQNGFSISLKSFRLEKRGKRGGKGVFASLFGVGAPEALVIGVVALLVFGPKGLAEIAKNLGKTLRAFQPTIRELQEVSREFKSTLEKEIGLDELQNSARGNTTFSPSTPSAAPPEKSWATAEEIAAAAVRNDDSLATATPTSDTNEDSQATPASPASVTEDSQATPAAVTEDSQATSATPAAITEDSQATPATPTAINEDSPSPRATTNGDSQAVATTPAATANDSQPTFNSN